MRSVFINILISAFILVLFNSCQSSIQSYINPTLDDGKYDSEFPYKSSSEQLEEITRTTKILNCIAYYESYVFDRSTELTKAKFGLTDIIDAAAQTGTFTNQGSGTATIIAEHFGSVSLLTCAHIVANPDTIISYHLDSYGLPTEFIESISIKVKQSNYIPEFPERGEVDIIALDKKNDLAIVGRHYGKKYNQKFNVFSYPTGAAKDLEWGSFVYTIGYPMNYQMISKGIVSSPNRNKKGSFLIDAVFNQGYSGGIVLAIRDGVPNFELVGLVNTVPSNTEYIIKPDEKNKELYHNPLIPYSGNIFTRRMTSIKYGIIKVVPIETIKKFIDDFTDELLFKGFDPQYFFQTDKKN